MRSPTDGHREKKESALRVSGGEGEHCLLRGLDMDQRKIRLAMAIASLNFVQYSPIVAGVQSLQRRSDRTNRTHSVPQLEMHQFMLHLLEESGHILPVKCFNFQTAAHFAWW